MSRSPKIFSDSTGFAFFMMVPVSASKIASAKDDALHPWTLVVDHTMELNEKGSSRS